MCICTLHPNPIFSELLQLWFLIHLILCFQREGLSKFNKIYEWKTMIQGQQCNMVMTSVSGHLLGLDFDERHRKWYSCEPIQLFEATLVKTCVNKNMINIKVNYIFGFCKKHIFSMARSRCSCRVYAFMAVCLYFCLT